MRKVLFLLLLSHQCQFCYGQVAAVQLDYQNFAYLGIANRLTVAVENTPNSAIVLSTDNGEIKKSEDGRQGHYTFLPKQFGSAEIYVSIRTKSGIKKIQTYYYRVRRLTIVPSFYGKNSGEIPLEILVTQMGLSASCGLEEGFDGRAQVINFSVVIIRQGSEVYRRSLNDPNGVIFDDESIYFFVNSTRDEDKLFFKDIKAKGPDGERDLQQMEFTIRKTHEIKFVDEIVVDPVTGQERKRKVPK